MESVARALAVYGILLLVFRMSGKRTLSQTTNFELVLLLIISETIQQAIVGDDRSMTNAVLLVLTLVGTSVLLSSLKQRFETLDLLIDGMPLVIVEDGALLRDRMAKERVDEGDLLAAARHAHGLERLDQIKYAVIERNGEITIVPRAEARR